MAPADGAANLGRPLPSGIGVGSVGARVPVHDAIEQLRSDEALIVGIRNRLVHAYFDVDHDVLWTTATQVLPALEAALGEGQGQG